MNHPLNTDSPSALKGTSETHSYSRLVCVSFHMQKAFCNPKTQMHINSVEGPTRLSEKWKAALWMNFFASIDKTSSGVLAGCARCSWRANAVTWRRWSGRRAASEFPSWITGGRLVGTVSALWSSLRPSVEVFWYKYYLIPGVLVDEVQNC